MQERFVLVLSTKISHKTLFHLLFIKTIWVAKIIMQNNIYFYINHNNKDNFNSLIRCLLYPCLFANKNSVSYKKAADNQLSYFGYLANIEETQEGYKFFFSIVSSLPQNIFNDNCAAFNLKTSIGENELDKVHWSIKKKNIVKSIRSLGFNVAAY